jgi:hypothetical protein
MNQKPNEQKMQHTALHTLASRSDLSLLMTRTLSTANDKASSSTNIFTKTKNTPSFEPVKPKLIKESVSMVKAE